MVLLSRFALAGLVACMAGPVLGADQDWQKVGRVLPEPYRYASNTNAQWLTIEQIQDMVAPIEAAYTVGKLD